MGEAEYYFVECGQNKCMLGMGSGQPNRLESLRIAMRKSGEEVKGAALASDAFFPFGNYQAYFSSITCDCAKMEWPTIISGENRSAALRRHLASFVIFLAN